MCKLPYYDSDRKLTDAEVSTSLPCLHFLWSNSHRDIIRRATLQPLICCVRNTSCASCVSDEQIQGSQAESHYLVRNFYVRASSYSQIIAHALVTYTVDPRYRMV